MKSEQLNCVREEILATALGLRQENEEASRKTFELTPIETKLKNIQPSPELEALVKQLSHRRRVEINSHSQLRA